MKKIVSTSIVRRRLCEIGLYDRTAVKKPLKQNNVKRHTKTRQESGRIKSFELMNQSLKSLGQIGGSICSEELVKELQLQYHTNSKGWRRLYYNVGGFCQLQSWGFAPGEGHIESDQPS